jgi:type II secretion system protein N
MTGARAKLLKRIGYPALFFAAFVASLYLTFPYGALARRLESEARKSGAEVSIESLGPAMFPGVRASGVTVKLADPQGGAPIVIDPDELVLGVGLWPLVSNRLHVDVRAQAWGGEMEGFFEPHRARNVVKASAAGVEIGMAPALKWALETAIGSAVGRLVGTTAGSMEAGSAVRTGLDAVGEVKADVDLAFEMTRGPTGQYLKADSTEGLIALQVGNAELRGGTVMGFGVPRIILGNVEARVQMEKGVATVQKAVIKSEDIELEADATIQLRPLLPLSRVEGKLRFKLGEPWLERNQSLRAMIQIGLQNARRSDGYYQYALSGTLGAMQARPQP